MSLAEKCLGFHQSTSLDIRREEKKKRNCKVEEKDYRLCFKWVSSCTAKYYSISVDSTPDISHSDKLCCIFRYVLDSQPVERFVHFIEMKGHGAAELEHSIRTFLEKHQIKLSDCRGQSYDNASNMSGKYSREKNPLADYIPCFAHYLNLVGHSAVDNISASYNFFELVENIY